MTNLIVGNAMVATSSNGGHGKEFFARRAVDKIMDVSDSAPEPIRAQAHAFKERMYRIVLASIEQAVASEVGQLKSKIEMER